MVKQYLNAVARKVIVVFFISFSGAFLFASGSSEEEPEIKEITEMQDRYTALADRVPAISVFPARGTSAIEPDILLALNEEILRQMTVRGQYKPVSTRDWMIKTFIKTPASTPFSFLQTIAAERYAVPLVGIIQSDVYRIENLNFIHVTYYSVTGDPYPVTVVRVFKIPEEIPTTVTACLTELEIRLRPEAKRTLDESSLKKIIVNDFTTSYRRLVTLESGEFDFVESPFIKINNTTLRQGDKFLSRVMSYVFETSFMFKSMHASDLSLYVSPSIKSTVHADYILDGDIQFSDHFSILTIYLRDAKTGAEISVFKLPFSEFSAEKIWTYARQIVARVVADRFPASQWKAVPSMQAQNGALYCSNMFVGWTLVEDMVLPRGRFRFDTGDFTASYVLHDAGLTKTSVRQRPKVTVGFLDNSIPLRSYFILIDDKCHSYVDQTGEYFWKLMLRSGSK